MCKCTPGIKTPFCGKGDCQWPEQKPNHQCPINPEVQHNFGLCSSCGEYTISAKSLKIDPVIEAVRKDLHDRSQLGIKKYGTTLADNKGDLRYWLNHSYEECLDQANYLKRAIMEIDDDERIGKVI